MGFKRIRLILWILFLSLVCGPFARTDAARPDDTHPPLSASSDEGLTSEEIKRKYDYEQMFKYVRAILTRPEARAFLRDVFAEALIIDPEEAKQFGFEAKALADLSESQFIMLLQENTPFWPQIDRYLKAVHRIDEGHQTLLEGLYDDWFPKFNQWKFDEAAYQECLYSKYIPLLIQTRDVFIPELKKYFKALSDLDPSDTEARKKLDDEWWIVFEKNGFQRTAMRKFANSKFVQGLIEKPESWALLDDFFKAITEINLLYTENLKLLGKQWRAKFHTLIDKEGLVKKLLEMNDLLRPTYLKTQDGSPGYTLDDQHLLFSHDRQYQEKTIPAGDLRDNLLEIIQELQKQIAGNYFDFDLELIADALIKKFKEGVTDIRWGFDKDVLAARPEVQAMYDKLKAAGIKVYAVDAVGLNHQKLIVVDWTLPESARVCAGSANATISCMHPNGDLWYLPDEVRPAYSIPNANHNGIIKSHILAILVNHVLTMHLDMGLRGDEIPLSGAYLLQGNNPHGLSSPPDLVVTFTPNGALDNVGRNVLSRLIRKIKGPIHIIQFAFSADVGVEALEERVLADFKATGKPTEVVMVLDPPFALMDWSAGLTLSGLQQTQREDGSKVYENIPNYRLKRALGEELYNKWRAHIKVAPPIYGTHFYDPGDGKPRLKVTSKIHQKVIVVGSFVVIFTSFNFSQGAETNNEQIFVFYDPHLADMLRQMIEGMAAQSEQSVYEAAMQRNDRERAIEAEAKTAFPPNGVKSCPDLLAVIKNKSMPSGSL